MAKGKGKRGNGQGTLYRRTDRGTWIMGWYDHAGFRRERSTGTTDRKAAERILAKQVADEALRREGVIDPKMDTLAAADRKAIAEHVEDYHRDLLARGNTKQHGDETRTLVNRVVDLGKVDRISNLTPARIREAVKVVRDQGKSLRSCNKALRAIKSFSRWLVANHRLSADPLAHVAGFNADTDKRRQRRAFDEDELARLIRAAEASRQVVEDVAPADRAMAYRLASGTGFRVSELKSLTPASFNLDADPPTIKVAAAYSKRRRDDEQPIRPDLADRIAAWLDGKPGDRPVLALPKETAEMLRRDMAGARIAWIREAKPGKARAERRETTYLMPADGSGRILDFHALRHTYISRLVASGASVKVAQELARHSTPTLTIGRYAHARLHDLTAALDALPREVVQQAEPMSLRATGTDGRSPRIDTSNRTGNRGAKGGISDATPCDSNPPSGGGRIERKRLQFRGISDDSSGEMVKGRGGIRTHESRICNPLH